MTLASIQPEQLNVAVHPAYLYDPAWQQEQERLQALEDLFDPASRHFIERLGLAPGWRCLEIGYGAGGLVGWLADRVGPTGGVVATDLKPRLGAEHWRSTVEVRQHDLVHHSLDEVGAFDLVHARAVLEHLAEPRQALAELASAVRPGGWLIVEDIDLGGPQMAAAAEHYVSPAGRGAEFKTIVEAMHLLFTRQGVQPAFGPSLPGALEAAGLGEVQAELHAPFVMGGAARDCMRLTVEFLRPHLVDAGLVDDADIDRFVRLTRAAGFHYVPIFMISAWGRRVA